METRISAESPQAAQDETKAVAATHQVDQVPPLSRLGLLGLQHVLVMYAGAVAVPLIVGDALGMSKDAIAFLISADLFCCGLMSIVQSMGIWKFGIRLPMMMGVTFTAVPAIIAAGQAPGLGFTAIFGAVMCAGLFTFLVAPMFVHLIRLFPPVVTGTVVLIIGLSLMGVGVNWAGGGQPMIEGPNGGLFPNPDYGEPLHLAIGAIVLALVLAVHVIFRNFIGDLSVLIALVIGFLIAIALGLVDFSGVASAPWVGLVEPLHFGLPQFDPLTIITLCIVMIVISIEGIGQFLAIADVCDRTVTPDDIVRGLRTDGLGGMVGGFMNTFTYTSFAQNIGLVQMTGVRSRWVCVSAGAILILLSIFPKMSYVIASMPDYVLGGAALVMFGMMAASGVRILGDVDFKNNEGNLYVVSISLAVGLIPMVAPTFFHQLPDIADRFLSDGILTGSITAVALNMIFNRGQDHMAAFKQGPLVMSDTNADEKKQQLSKTGKEQTVG